MQRRDNQGSPTDDEVVEIVRPALLALGFSILGWATYSYRREWGSILSRLWRSVKKICWPRFDPRRLLQVFTTPDATVTEPSDDAITLVELPPRYSLNLDATPANASGSRARTHSLPASSTPRSNIHLQVPPSRAMPPLPSRSEQVPAYSHFTTSLEAVPAPLTQPISPPRYSQTAHPDLPAPQSDNRDPRSGGNTHYRPGHSILLLHDRLDSIERRLRGGGRSTSSPDDLSEIESSSPSSIDSEMQGVVKVDEDCSVHKDLNSIPIEISDDEMDGIDEDERARLLEWDLDAELPPYFYGSGVGIRCVNLGRERAEEMDLD